MFSVDGSTTTSRSQTLESASALVAEVRLNEATNTTTPNQKAPYAATTAPQTAKRAAMPGDRTSSPPTTKPSSEKRNINATTRPARTATLAVMNVLSGTGCDNSSPSVP